MTAHEQVPQSDDDGADLPRRSSGQPSRVPHQRRSVLDDARAEPESPMRPLLVAVPVAVVLAVATNLFGVWSFPSQKAARDARETTARQAPAQDRLSAPQALAERIRNGLKDLWPDEKPRDPRPAPGRQTRASDDVAPRPSQPPAASKPAAQPQLPSPLTSPTDRASKQPTPVDPRAVVALIGVAQPADGETLFRLCQVCHASEKGAANKIGPNLWGVVGAPKASRNGYSYSRSLEEVGGIWTYEDLARYLNDPKAFAPGTKMAFRGVTEPLALARLISYLRTLSDTPEPMPP